MSAVACPTQTTASRASLVTGVFVFTTFCGLEKNAAAPRTPARPTQQPGRPATTHANSARLARRRKTSPDVDVGEPHPDRDRCPFGEPLVRGQTHGLDVTVFEIRAALFCRIFLTGK